MNNQSQLNSQKNQLHRAADIHTKQNKSEFNEVSTVDIKVRFVRATSFALISRESNAPSCRCLGYGLHLPILFQWRFTDDVRNPIRPLPIRPIALVRIHYIICSIYLYCIAAY